MAEQGHMALLCPNKLPSTPGLGSQPLGASSAPHPNTGPDEMPPSRIARQFCGRVSGPHLAELRDTGDISHLPAPASTSSISPAFSECAWTDEGPQRRTGLRVRHTQTL